MEEAFDFARYVSIRKGMQQAQRREGLGYAFSADTRLRNRLQHIAPLQWVLEDIQRRFQGQSHKPLLQGAERVLPSTNAMLHQVLQTCAQILHISTPPLYLSQEIKELQPLSFGEDAYLVAPTSWLSHLSSEAWYHVLGAACGHIQNGHGALLTARFYSQHQPQGWAKWTALPVRATLDVWYRRAVITSDRAGLICTKNLAVSQQALEGMVSDPAERALRFACLQQFAKTQYFQTVCQKPGGDSLEACDEAVATMLDKNAPMEAAS